MKTRLTGPAAAKWRKIKFDLLRRFSFPAQMLPGSLVLSHRRCGKTTCHCATGEGHPTWTLTFMADKRKRVEHIPHDLVEEVQQRVHAGREFQEALRTVLRANAELLVLERKQRQEAARKKRQKKRTPMP
jgi:hypothetical protein